MDDVTNASEERDISELNIATADMILNPDPRGEGHADDENAEEEEDDEEETMIDELTAEGL